MSGWWGRLRALGGWIPGTWLLGREEIQVELVNVVPWANCLEGALGQEGSSGFLSCVTLKKPFPPCASM